MKEIRRIRAIRVQEEIDEQEQEILRTMGSIDNILDEALTPHIHEQLNRLLESIFRSEIEADGGMNDVESLLDRLPPMDREDPALANLAFQMYYSDSYDDLITAINDFFQ